MFPILHSKTSFACIFSQLLNGKVEHIKEKKHTSQPSFNEKGCNSDIMFKGRQANLAHRDFQQIGGIFFKRWKFDFQLVIGGTIVIP